MERLHKETIENYSNKKVLDELQILNLKIDTNSIAKGEGLTAGINRKMLIEECLRRMEGRIILHAKEVNSNENN